jgi:hypothetical protein
LNKNGKEVATCLKCRTKAKRYDQKPERREAHNKLQSEKRYDIEWRAKQLEERPDEYRKHNNEVIREWRADNNEHVRRWYRINVNPRLDALKRAAITRGIAWNLTDEEAKVMLTSPCVYCKHIDLEVRVNGIDRLDSARPYETANCRPYCKDCNYMKGTYDPKTFIERAKKIAMCDAEFPEVPTCLEHKRINRTPQATEQETPTTP